MTCSPSSAATIPARASGVKAGGKRRNRGTPPTGRERRGGECPVAVSVSGRGRAVRGNLHRCGGLKDTLGARHVGRAALGEDEVLARLQLILVLHDVLLGD